MRILIITFEPFPIGLAATNRILSLAKGLAENGASVNVICTQPTERFYEGAVNNVARGTFEGVDFEYPCGTTVRGETFLHRRRLTVKGMIRTLRILIDSTNNGGPVFVMQYLRDPKYVLLYYFLSRLLRMRYVRDVSEYPIVTYKKSLGARAYQYLYSELMFRVFDAVLVMTKPLEIFFTNRVRRSAKLMMLPMTVEASRFSGTTTPSPDTRPYIAYCGHVGGDKDGVPILIRAFATLSAKHSNVSLYIIGNAPQSDDLSHLRELASSLGVGANVVFTGRVLRDEIPGYLCNASILALSRPTGPQSESGFPSKLGEYLSTGNPVVVTRVGDIPSYLSDGESAFLVEPDNVKAFAEKLDYVLSHPALAREVGRNGRKVALEHFDHMIQGKRLFAFLSDLVPPGD